MEFRYIKKMSNIVSSIRFEEHDDIRMTIALSRPKTIDFSFVMYLKSHVYGVSAGTQVLSSDHIDNIIHIPLILLWVV